MRGAYCRAAALRQEEAAGLVVGLLPALDAVPFHLSLYAAPSPLAAAPPVADAASASEPQASAQPSQSPQDGTDSRQQSGRFLVHGQHLQAGAAAAKKGQPPGNATAALLITSLGSLVGRRAPAAPSAAPSDPEPHLVHIRSSSCTSKRSPFTPAHFRLPCLAAPLLKLSAHRQAVTSASPSKTAGSARF